MGKPNKLDKLGKSSKISIAGSDFEIASDAIIDDNTLVSSDLTLPRWGWRSAGQDAYVATATVDGDYALINNGLDANGYLWRAHQFVAPPGCTEVTVKYTVRTGQDEDSGHKIQFLVLNRDLSAAIEADTVRTLTDTDASYSFTASVTAGTEYAVGLFAARGAEFSLSNRCKVKDVSVEIDAGTGIFAGDFKRINVDDTTLDMARTLLWFGADTYRCYGSCFSRVRLLTNASSVAIDYQSNINPAGYGDIGLWDSGSPVDSVQAADTNQAYLGTLTPSTSGRRYLDVVNGVEQGTEPTIAAAMVRGIYVADPDVEVHTLSVSPTLVVYGDSLAAGGNAAVPPNETATVLIRSESKHVIVEAWGSRALNGDGVDASARTTFATLLAAYGANVYYLCIGTNDYGLEPWSAADFGVAYADLLDKILVADPAAAVYCQTPLVRSDESANTHGDTLGDYRTVIATAVSSRTSFCTLVDGSTMLVTGDLEDGIHPTTAGHVKWAAAITTALGW